MPSFILSQPSADMAMMAAYAASGWKDILIDLEHSPHGEADVVRAMTALGHAGARLHLKMANLEPESCGRYLSFGVRSFMLPHVEDAASFRAVREELSRQSWIDPASVSLRPLIESRAALHALPAICAEDGVTAIQIGLVDMAIDLGFPFQGFRHLASLGRALMPHLLEALDAVRACGKPNGCMLLPGWFEFFPLDRVDQVVVPLGELLSRPIRGEA